MISLYLYCGVPWCGAPLAPLEPREGMLKDKAKEREQISGRLSDGAPASQCRPMPQRRCGAEQLHRARRSPGPSLQLCPCRRPARPEQRACSLPGPRRRACTSRSYGGLGPSFALSPASFFPASGGKPLVFAHSLQRVLI